MYKNKLIQKFDLQYDGELRERLRDMSDDFGISIVPSLMGIWVEYNATVDSNMESITANKLGTIPSYFLSNGNMCLWYTSSSNIVAILKDEANKAFWMAVWKNEAYDSEYFVGIVVDKANTVDALPNEDLFVKEVNNLLAKIDKEII